MEVIYHPETVEEANHSIAWHNEKQLGLVERFKSVVLNSIDSIKDSPNIWPKQFYGAHRFLLKHFPYGIFYTISKHYITIIAVANLNRRPYYWSQRLWTTN